MKFALKTKLIPLTKIFRRVSLALFSRMQLCFSVSFSTFSGDQISVSKVLPGVRTSFTTSSGNTTSNWRKIAWLSIAILQLVLQFHDIEGNANGEQRRRSRMRSRSLRSISSDSMICLSRDSQPFPHECPIR